MLKNIRLVLISVCLILVGCNNGIINENFQVQTNDISDNNELLYIDDDKNMYTVIDRKVFAYKQCGDVLLIKQHPLNSDKTDNSTIHYYIIDLKKDYSEESVKPYDVSFEAFKSQLKGNCNNDEFIEM